MTIVTEEPPIRVCIMTSVHKPFDDRIFHKQAITISRAGYDVSLIAKHDRDEVVGGVRVVRVHSPTGLLHRVTSMQLRMLFAALKVKARIYHFHDPELIAVGLVLKLFGNKVIYDVHELVYYQIENKNWIRHGAVKKMVQLIYRGFEWLAVKCFDGVVLAEDDYLNYFRRVHGHTNTYCIVRNSPVLSLIRNAAPQSVCGKRKAIVIYAGGLTKHRGIREIVEAMAIVGERAELYLLGEWESKEFMGECARSAGWPRTTYLGYRPLEEVYGFMKAADVGIAVLHPIKNYLTSLPVKVFEYMVCSLPIVVSDFPCWRTTFGGCALFVDPRSASDIAEKIVQIIENPSMAHAMVRNGMVLIEREYNWGKESAKLLDLYRKLAN